MEHIKAAAEQSRERAGKNLDHCIAVMQEAVDRAKELRARLGDTPDAARQVLHAFAWGLANSTCDIETALAAFEDAHQMDLAVAKGPA